MPTLRSGDHPRHVMRPPQAADYLGMSETALKRLRLRGDGPAFAKLGHRTVVYLVAELDRFLASRMQRSTSDRLRGAA